MNLRPATAYKLTIMALNEKGASRAHELKALTIKVPETQEETSAGEFILQNRIVQLPTLSILSASLWRKKLPMSI